MRVKAVLRRTATKEETTGRYISFKGLRINMNLKEVEVDGAPLQLTKTEFELLRLFLENEGRVFSRAEILRKVWHDDAEVLDRTIDVNITRLRKKLGAYGKYIATRQGYGYYFETNQKE